MDLRICSDIHLEHYKYVDKITNPRLQINSKDVLPIFGNESEQILILAGDVIQACYIHEYENFFSDISSRFRYVVMVAGNHEHYENDFNDTISDMKCFLKPFGNIKLLDNETINIDDVSFFGCTWWTDLEFAPSETLYHLKSMSDYRYIYDGHSKNLSYFRTTYEHRKSSEEIKYFCRNNPDNKKVIITHHAPSMKSCHPKFINHALTPCFINDYDKHIDILQPNLWVHGHCHNNSDYKIGDTRVVANPYGYFSENFNYNKTFLLTI